MWVIYTHHSTRCGCFPDAVHSWSCISRDILAIGGLSFNMFYLALQRLTALICLLLLARSGKADTSTRIVSITSTTTVRVLGVRQTLQIYHILTPSQVHVTATDYQGACENFVGACVVYGTYASAPYTTTVYRYAPSPSPPRAPAPPPTPSPRTNTITTSTRVILATTTASNEGACSNFRGACVVYGSNTVAGQPTRTVYYDGTSTVVYAGASATPTRPGGGQGYIGPKADAGDGVIGGAAGIDRWTWITVVGAAFVCAMLML